MPRFLPLVLCALVLSPLLTLEAPAAVQRVALGAEAGAADGSAARPWPSVAAALASGAVAGGDEIRLAAGDYGPLVISDAIFDSPVIIGPLPGSIVHLTGIKLIHSRNLVIDGFAVWPDAATPPDAPAPDSPPDPAADDTVDAQPDAAPPDPTAPDLLTRGHLVQVDGTSDHVIFRHLDIRGTKDAAGYATWTLADWQAHHRPGVMLRGPDNAIEDSTLTGISFGIAAIGPRDRIERNLVQGFSGDGMRVLGDDTLVRGNRVQDCVQIDKNHADGLQSWSRGPTGAPGKGVVTGLIFDSNMFLEWASSPVSPLRCSLQGIGLFDGMFQNLIIRNNLVFVSAYHGISVAGALDTQIVNNTVVNNRKPGERSPWIGVGPHKNGTPSERVLIANNIAARLMFRGKPGPTITLTDNLLTTFPAQVLTDPYHGDFHPMPGGAAARSGDASVAPATDISGTPRPAGVAPDIGAFTGN